MRRWLWVARVWQWLARRADCMGRASDATSRAALAAMRVCERRAARAMARAIGRDPDQVLRKERTK
jgi:hypothetical protein